MSKNKTRIQFQNNAAAPKHAEVEITEDEIIAETSNEENSVEFDVVPNDEKKDEVPVEEEVIIETEPVKEEEVVNDTTPDLPVVEKAKEVALETTTLDEPGVSPLENLKAKKISNISQIAGTFTEKKDEEASGIKVGSLVKIKDSAEKTFTGADIIPIARHKRYTVEKIFNETGRIVLVSGTFRIAVTMDDIYEV